MIRIVRIRCTDHSSDLPDSSFFADFLDFLEGHSVLMHSSILPNCIMGAPQSSHDLPVGWISPLGLRGYVCVQVGHSEQPANRFPALENIILMFPLPQVGQIPRYVFTVLLLHFGSIQDIWGGEPFLMILS